MTAAASIEALKIFGERNSGTNYVEQLVLRNFDVEVLRGVAPVPSFAMRAFRRIVGLFSMRTADDLLERNRDRFFRDHFDQSLGWKHARVPVEKYDDATFSRVGFLMLVKHPYAWALSLFRRPYHSGRRPEDGWTFERFLEAPYRVVEREELGREALCPAEIWNRKAASYVELERQAPFSLTCKYENFLSSEDGELARVEERFGIRRQRHERVEASTKGDDKSHADYAAYYLGERWREKLSSEAISIMNAGFDRSLVEHFGYSTVEH